MLARTSLAGGASDQDAARAYVWFSMAADQLTRAKDNAKKAMTAAQLADAERQLRERMNKWQQLEQRLTGRSSSHYEHRGAA
jgi:hypothetical protein